MSLHVNNSPSPLSARCRKSLETFPSYDDFISLTRNRSNHTPFDPELQEIFKEPLTTIEKIIRAYEVIEGAFIAGGGNPIAIPTPQPPPVTTIENADSNLHNAYIGLIWERTNTPSPSPNTILSYIKTAKAIINVLKMKPRSPTLAHKLRKPTPRPFNPFAHDDNTSISVESS